MKLTEMNLELAQNLMNWWIETGDSRIDEFKNPDLLYSLMFQDGGKSQFYAIPELLLIVNSIVAGKNAVIYEIGILGDGYDTREAKRELIEIVKEYNLKRLTFICPSPVTLFSTKLKDLGFKYEGRMRHAAIYNGKLCDVDIFGFYSVKPQSRRRRGRRKKDSFKDYNGAGIRQPDTLHGEETRSRDLERELQPAGIS